MKPCQSCTKPTPKKELEANKQKPSSGFNFICNKCEARLVDAMDSLKQNGHRNVFTAS